MDQPNFYAPPAAPILAEAVPSIEAAERVEYAGFAIRAGARMLDGFIELVLTMVGGAAGTILVTGILRAGPDSAAWFAHMKEPGVSRFVADVLASFFYYALADRLGGATMGKLLFGLRVRSSITLGPCPLGGALIRELAYYLDSFFFGLIAFSSMARSRTKQRRGDRWGKTVVVKARSLEHGPTAGELALGNVVAAVASMGCVAAEALFRWI